MNGYLISLIVLSSLGTGMTLVSHGKPKIGNHDIFISITATAIHWFLLYKAGLFN